MFMDQPDIPAEVEQIFLGADFGDATFEAAMRREFVDRLTESKNTGKPLRIYAGYDPSKPDLHLGHSITLRKLRLFQDLGHDVVFLVGTFTAQVGDASDKSEGRPRLREQQVMDAARTYAEQAFLILDPDKTTVVYNHTWLGKLTLADAIRLAAEVTVQQSISRESFRARLDRGDPIGLHELFYPLLQGHDAVELHADVQLGATEQLFNILTGRKLQERAGQAPCIPITFPVLVGLDGKSRMSKSAGNYVGLSEPPNEQFGKVMSIDDDTMRQWIPLVSSWSVAEVRDRLARLERGELKPMDLKKDLAADIVTMYHGAAAAEAARSQFEQVHQQRDYADLAPTIEFEPPFTLLDAVMSLDRVTSKKEARRLLQQGGVRVNDEPIHDETRLLESGDLVRVGKRDFFRVAFAPS
jgi:tyrosyl-tRNA synthetase